MNFILLLILIYNGQVTLKENFCGNLNKAISLAEIASSRFSWKIFLKRKLTLNADCYL